MSIFSKKAKQESLPAPLLLSEAGKVHTETVFYTMPAKFLVPDKPPFWTAGKIWLGVAVLMAGLIGVVYWLLATAKLPAARTPVVVSSKSSDVVVLEPSSSSSPSSEQPETKPVDQPSTEAPTEPPAVEQPPVEIPPPATSPSLSPLLSSSDSDQDGLTDIEESLYGTASAKVDTDGDGYTDQQEVLNGFNPKDSGRLVDSGLIKTYTSMTTPLFTVVYPFSWSLERGSDNNDDLRFVGSPDEFISINLEPNNNLQSLPDWYKTVAPDVDSDTLSFESIGSHLGIFSPDRQTFYFIDTNRPREIFVINYNSGTKTELNFRTTLEAVIRSITLAR